MMIQQLAAALMTSGRNPILVSPSTAGVSGLSDGVACYAGIQYSNTGEEFQTNSIGQLSYDVSRGLWLDNRNPDDVWVQWVRSGGSLGDWNSEDAGDARVNLATTRSWRIVRAAIGVDTIQGTFNFYDAASGGKLLGSTGALLFTAERDAGGG